MLMGPWREGRVPAAAPARGGLGVQSRQGKGFAHLPTNSLGAHPRWYRPLGPTPYPRPRPWR